MNKTFIVAAAALLGFSISLPLPIFPTVPAKAEETEQEVQVYRDVKKVPIAVYQIKAGIPPGKIIGRATRGLFGIVVQEWHMEDIGDASKFIDRVYRSLKKAGYTPAIEVKEEQAAGSGSVFGDLTENTPKTPSPQARFMIGGTITKTWMTVRDNGWGGWATDVDMKVKWEVYDTLQNKVIHTQETYAVDEGGGLTGAYFFTVMEKVAAKFFRSEEFEAAIQQNLAIVSATEGSVKPNTQSIQITSTDPMDSVIKVLAGRGQHASGFALNHQNKQYIITNYHVVENAPTLIVKTRDGRSFSASIVASNAVYDLALLSVPQLQLLGLKLHTKEPESGTSVQVLGNPAADEFIVAAGQISRMYREGELKINVSRPFGSFVNGRNIHVLYEINAPIVAGNSGGPVIDENNQVIGVVSWGRENSTRTFILPANNIIECFNLEDTN